MICIVHRTSSGPTNSQSCMCCTISLALSVSPSLRHFSGSCISKIIYKTLLLTSFSSNYFSSSLSLSSLPMVLRFSIFLHEVVHEITCKLCSVSYVRSVWRAPSHVGSEYSRPMANGVAKNSIPKQIATHPLRFSCVSRFHFLLYLFLLSILLHL